MFYEVQVTAFNVSTNEITVIFIYLFIYFNIFIGV